LTLRREIDNYRQEIPLSRQLMNRNKIAISRQTFRQLSRAVLTFLKSPESGKAKWLAASLLLLMLCINGMNVVNSFVARDFMSSIEKRDAAGFVHYAWLYVGVFAVSTLVAVYFRFCEERLGLLWRDYLTHRIVGGYIDRRLYLHLEHSGEVSNSDQRMTEDVKQLTTTTLSFLLLILGGSLTAISFSSVLWTISPKLFVIAVLYAAAGSALTIWLGRPLIRLNYQQSDFEANFRAELIRLRENADTIALGGNEARVRNRIMGRVDDLVSNLKRIIRVNRNLNFFTNGYNYMIQLIPILIVAPLFMDHGVEFGVIAQAGMAFATLLGAFSLIITQFQAISSYASVVTRLEEFVDAAEKTARRSQSSAIRYSTGTDGFKFSDLTLRSAREKEVVLLKDLNATFAAGKRILVHGSNHGGRTVLYMAAAGLYEEGSGSIIRPAAGTVVFIPARPYLLPGTLNELLTSLVDGVRPGEAEIMEIVRETGLESAVRKHGGLNSLHNWLEVLSIQDQQRLIIARAILAKPNFAFLDQLDAAFNDAEHARALKLLANHNITCVSFGDHEPDGSRHDACLELNDDGSWNWTCPEVVKPTGSA
jgi:putative ATP-binding cassette transporter